MLILNNLLETSWCADAWEFEWLSPVGSFEERPKKVSPFPIFAPFSFLFFCSWSQDNTAFVTSSDDLCLIILLSLQPRPFLSLAATENTNKEKERDLDDRQGAPQQFLLHLGHHLLVILVPVSQYQRHSQKLKEVSSSLPVNTLHPGLLFRGPILLGAF